MITSQGASFAMNDAVKRDFTRWASWFLIGVLAMLLVGCATPQSPARQATSADFERSGRFAVAVEYFGGKRDAVQGGFSWLDQGRRLVLDLRNPMGSTLARVQVDASGALLVRSNGEREHAPHPDALVEQVLGSPVPVAGLRDWLHGRTGGAPGDATGLQRDSEGRLSSFNQDGWRVQLSRYDGLGPRLLQMNRNEASRSISVRLVVDDN